MGHSSNAKVIFRPETGFEIDAMEPRLPDAIRRRLTPHDRPKPAGKTKGCNLDAQDLIYYLPFRDLDARRGVLGNLGSAVA